MGQYRGVSGGCCRRRAPTLAWFGWPALGPGYTQAVVPSRDAALAFEGVSKRYRKGILALNDVTWSVRLGARACLLGPNGAGKSTAIRLLQGAIEPTDGRVCLLGTEVNRGGYLAARRRTGVVPQGPGMYSDVTVGEYLRLAQRLYGCGDVARTEEAFGLAPYRGRMLSQLSGGFQRRVSLATALLAGPDLLLLDEPTVGLDPVATNDVHGYLREAMPGRTTLLCTHNLTEAEALCDEVIILRDGKVLVQESLEDLRGGAHQRLRLAARQGAPALLRALDQRGLRGVADGEGVLVIVDEPEAVAPDLLRGLLNEGLDVYECRPVQATLQELFLEAVREPE